MSRRAPRPVSAALEGLTSAIAPASTLARVQERWDSVVGPAIAAASRPNAERDGVLTVLCESAVWAQELDLMGPELVARLNGALGAEADGDARAARPIRELRCRCG